MDETTSRKIPKIVLDTNNINAYGTNLDLIYIEKCEKQGLIEIYYGLDTLHDLNKDNSRNPIRLNKFGSKEKVYSTGILGFSFLPFVLGDDSIVKDLSLIIFEKQWVELGNSITDNSKIDIKLIEASILSKINYFVTQERKLIEKSDRVFQKYGLQIVNREAMRNILEQEMLRESQL